MADETTQEQFSDEEHQRIVDEVMQDPEIQKMVAEMFEALTEDGGIVELWSRKEDGALSLDTVIAKEES